ncbi:Apoptosis antagonizing transcription factor [Teratosphaeria destructans]|uniref:Protein BFR2 n=1 Tax=Teratosphaeria destructans TaxID=418781 RepID=A0A9W7SSH2_9PEZI|nr:Apoptosis antagonizing transcription factor [Teratosphaeria destructans]
MGSFAHPNPEPKQPRRGPSSPALSTIEELSEPSSRRASGSNVSKSPDSSPEPFSEVGDTDGTEEARSSGDGRDTVGLGLVSGIALKPLTNGCDNDPMSHLDPTPSPTIRPGAFRLPSITPSPPGGFLDSPRFTPERHYSPTRPHRITKHGHKHRDHKPCILASCPYFWKKRGRLGSYQGNATLTAGREVPGRRARWSASRPGSGDIWTYPLEVYLGRQIQNVLKRTWAREVTDDVEDGLQLGEDDAQDMFKIMNHPNLVSIVDWDGFGEDGYGGAQDNVRRELAWERCNAGTLNRLIQDYGRPLPESFIWHTLLSMLRALQYLSYGQSNMCQVGIGGTVSDLIVDGWRPILHNQINPANIFYCKPVQIQGYKKTCYGPCKLGNFSNALVLRRPLWFWDRELQKLLLGHDSISTLELDRRNIARERHRYYDYDAPELSIYAGQEVCPIPVSTRSEKSRKHDRGAGIVGNASDIWSLGAVIVVMMTGGKQNIWDILAWAYTEDESQTIGPTGRARLIARLVDEIDAVDEDGEPYLDPVKDLLPDQYSDELRQLVSLMMDPRPQLRLEIHELLEQGLGCYRRMRRKERAAGRESEGEWTLAETLDGDMEEDEDDLGDLDSDSCSMKSYDLDPCFRHLNPRAEIFRFCRSSKAQVFEKLLVVTLQYTVYTMALTKSHNRAKDFDDLVDAAPKDFDPEADDIPDDSDDGDDDRTGDAREHYVDVGKSKLRRPKDVALGPQYRGSRVSRDQMSEDEDNPFSRGFDDEESEDDTTDGASEDDGDAEDEEDEDEEGTPDTDVSDGEDAAAGPRPDLIPKASQATDLRTMMQEGRKTVGASLSEANKADAEKGRAVKRQRKAFDSLLGTRMKLQKALIGVNTLAGLPQGDLRDQRDEANDAIEAAETAAFNLWSSLNNFREELLEAKTGTKRKRATFTMDTSTEKLWSHMQSQESDSIDKRNATLARWSAKTRNEAAKPQMSQLTTTAGSTIMDVIREQLTNSERLVKRARTPRSCAPLQLSNRVEEDPKIYDDADFYGLMLKELLEQKSADSVSASNVNIDLSFQMRREAKTKKNVDTKASKGRKLRYTVHEKLQNFMAPEDRRTWGERQTDELFGSLFGQKLGLAEGGEEQDEEMGDGEDVDAEEAGLMLFRS